MESEKFNIFLSKVKNAKSIVLCRHINPDGDCLGAQAALYYFFKKNFPKKIIDCIGDVNEEYLKDLFPLKNKRDRIKKQKMYDLQIIVDTSSIDRIDGDIGIAKELILIDHHPHENIVADLDIRNEMKSSACEICSDLLFYLVDNEGFSLDKKIATFLFIGIITDTKRMWYNLTPKLLQTTARIIEHGVDTQHVYESIFYWNTEEIKFRNKLIDKAKIEETFVYVILEKKDYKNYGLSYQHAKDLALSLVEIKEAHYFSIIVKNEETGLYHASLRSKRKRIDKIAKSFGGGGHQRASGVRVKGRRRVNELIDVIREYSQK